MEIKNNKFMLVLIGVIVVIAIIGVVMSGILTPSKTVGVGVVNFSIPADYELDGSPDSFSSLDTVSYTNGENTITLSTNSNPSYRSGSEGDPMTINGNNGYYTHLSNTNEFHFYRNGVYIYFATNATDYMSVFHSIHV